MKHLSQNSLVDNKLKNKYKMFVIFKTLNKNFVLNNLPLFDNDKHL